MTNLDRVHCISPYEEVHSLDESEIDGNYETCDLPCHSECAGGCNRKNDPRSCTACMDDTVTITQVKFECMSDCGKNMTAIQWGQETDQFTLTTRLYESCDSGLALLNFFLRNRIYIKDYTIK